MSSLRRLLGLAALFASTAALTHGAAAHEWSQAWKPSPSQGEITAEITPLLYDKRWVYTIQVDDNPVWVHDFGADLFASVQFTDAPPGVPGGRAHSVVGDVAIWVTKIGANSSYLSVGQMKELRTRGWDFSNHSYSHRGRSWGNPPEELTAEEIREELFWSQSVLATILEDRPPAHFVYPNGYLGYQALLEEFGFRSACLVGGSGGRNLHADSLDLQLLSRNYLDEGNWTSQWNKGDPMAGLKEPPREGDVVIDFTHKISDDPESKNRQRWAERLETISRLYGAEGEDSFWSAPVAEVIDYHLAAQSAKVSVSAEGLKVQLPESSPGSRLTIRLQGVEASTEIPTPEGGLVHRDGDTVWITTPFLGLPGQAPPQPAVRKIWEGPPGEFVAEEPFRLAAVRIIHSGKPPEEVEITCRYRDVDGVESVVASKTLPSAWTDGALLFPVIPNQEAPLAEAVEVTPHPVFSRMEVWALTD